MGLVLLLTQMLHHSWWAVICLLYMARLAYNYRRLSFIPGPTLAGWTDIWRYYHGKAGKCIEDYQLHRRYNSKLLRVGPNQISVSDATEVGNIYGLTPIFNKVIPFQSMRRSLVNFSDEGDKTGRGIHYPQLQESSRRGDAQPLVNER